MKKISLILLSFVALFSVGTVKGQDFFDTSDATKFFTLGGRIGFNTSNRTFPSGHFNQWSNNSWGIGFNVGAVANLNFKEYLTLQPGIFYESRSGNYAYLTEYINYYGTTSSYYEMGHLRAYYITVPVLGVVKFNLADYIKWSVEFGPYFQVKLKETGQNNVTVLYREPQSNQYLQYTARHRNYDIGFKMGSGLQFFQHYYVGFHYLAGVCNAWKLPSGGRNKSWMFTVGYDF
ncbi:MAG: PorT family protein [Muribaculaceae bacterium]|nr:PorT family protein [Muribaculaceae bacterium]